MIEAVRSRARTTMKLKNRLNEAQIRTTHREEDGPGHSQHGDEFDPEKYTVRTGTNPMPKLEVCEEQWSKVKRRQNLVKQTPDQVDQAIVYDHTRDVEKMQRASRRWTDDETRHRREMYRCTNKSEVSERVSLRLSNFDVGKNILCLDRMRVFLHFVVPLYQKVERWTCPPFVEFRVLRSCDESFSF